MSQHVAHFPHALGTDPAQQPPQRPDVLGADAAVRSPAVRRHLAGKTNDDYTGGRCCHRAVPTAPSDESEIRMSDADPTALIERLRRANRRWKRLAALLAIALVGAAAAIAVQHGRTAAVFRAAEQASRAEQGARQEAERQRAEGERARDEARRALYVAHIRLATLEWERDGAGGGPKP